MHKEFEVNKVTAEGFKVMDQIAGSFDNLLNILLSLHIEDCREMSIVRTKLQEACFFAKKSVASRYKE